MPASAPSRRTLQRAIDLDRPRLGAGRRASYRSALRVAVLAARDFGLVGICGGRNPVAADGVGHADEGHGLKFHIDARAGNRRAARVLDHAEETRVGAVSMVVAAAA